MEALFLFSTNPLSISRNSIICIGSNQLIMGIFSFTKSKKASLDKGLEKTIIKKNQIHEKDNGSSEVQVAILSTKIEELAKHLKRHKKDNTSRRGLIKMVADRRTHLKYLERKDKTRYNALMKKMNLA